MAESRSNVARGPATKASEPVRNGVLRLHVAAPPWRVSPQTPLTKNYVSMSGGSHT